MRNDPWAKSLAGGADDAIPFKMLFDAAPAIISVHRGPDHHYIYSNPAHDAVVGHRLLAGLPLREAMAELADQDVFERFDAVYRTGEAFDVPELEVEIVNADGTRSRGYYRHVLQPWRDESGDIAGVMNFSYDVTSQVQARLRAETSERNLSYSLDIVQSVGVYDWDTKLDSVVVDGRFLSVFGMDPDREKDTLPLADFFAAIHEEDRPRVAAAVQRAVETGEIYDESYRVTGNDSEQRHVLAKGRCLRDEQGRPHHFTGVVVDVTREHFDARALQESEARLRTIFSSIDQGYALAEMILDENGQAVDYRFLEVNATFEEMTGLQNAAGQTIKELVPNIEEKWVDTYAEVAFGTQTLRFEDRSDALARSFDVFATPVPPKGRFALVFKDVTEAKRTHQALLRSEAEFRSMTEAMPQMVWATRPDGHHEFYNARWYEFTGVPEGSTDGEGWNGMFHPEDQDRAWARWRHSLATGEPYDIEYRLRHHSLGYRWVLGRAQPVRNAAGDIVRWLGTCTDIHEIKLAEQQRQLMLGEMNHRVKNTLAMVHAVVSQTLRQAEDIDDARQAIQARIGSLSQAHDRLVHSEWTAAQVGEVIEAALAPHRMGTGRFKLQGPELDIGSKQALALTMALHELATNAIKYGALSEDHGRVSISWQVKASENDKARFVLSWVESGGPPVQPPMRRGFGSRMIEQALPSYFDAQAELSYGCDGLKFEMNGPIEGLTR